MAIAEAAASPVNERPRRRRPFGVIVLALIHVIYAALGLAAVYGVAEARPGSGTAALLEALGRPGPAVRDRVDRRDRDRHRALAAGSLGLVPGDDLDGPRPRDPDPALPGAPPELPAHGGLRRRSLLPQSARGQGGLQAPAGRASRPCSSRTIGRVPNDDSAGAPRRPPKSAGERLRDRRLGVAAVPTSICSASSSRSCGTTRVSCSFRAPWSPTSPNATSGWAGRNAIGPFSCRRASSQRTGWRPSRRRPASRCSCALCSSPFRRWSSPAGRGARDGPVFRAPSRLARVGIVARLIDAGFNVSLLLRGTVPGGTAAAAQIKYEAAFTRDPRYVYHGRVVREQRLDRAPLHVLLLHERLALHVPGRERSRGRPRAVVRRSSRRGPTAREPVWFACAAHDYSGDDLRRRWDDPLLVREGDHPVIHAGAGSHAAYFEQGEYLTAAPIPAARADPRRARRACDRSGATPSARMTRATSRSALPVP